jgi:hypothetical protein
MATATLKNADTARTNQDLVDANWRRHRRGWTGALVKTIGALLVTVLVISLTGCKSTKSTCAEIDLDCLVDALVIEQGGQPLELQPVASAALRAHYPVQSSASDVWAVGAAGTILRWTPAIGWSISPSPTTQQLNSVWGSARDDVWAVGKAGTIVHWNGTAWASSVSGTSTELLAVYGSSDTNAWAVGDGGTILQWNGLGWVNVPSGTTNRLSGVWTNGSNAWAVGLVGLALQWTGGVWTPQPIPIPSSELLSAVGGSSVSDLWIVGTHGSAAHSDGTTWTSANSPDGDWMLSVGGSGPADVWSATYASSSLLHWTGSRWNQVSTGTTGLKSVWAAATDDAWAVGYSAVHWNGYQWTSVDVPSTNSLFSVFGFAPAVGSTSGPTAWRTTGSPADPLTLDCPAARVPLDLGFRDPNGCTPSLCFSACSPSHRCSSRAVCTKAIKDGQTSGVWRSNLGFRTGPAESSISLDLRADVFSDPTCSPFPASAGPNMGTRGGTGTSVPVTINKPGPTGCPDEGGGGSGGGTGGAAGSGGRTDAGAKDASMPAADGAVDRGGATGDGGGRDAPVDVACCACIFDVTCTAFGAGGCWRCHNAVIVGGACQAPSDYLTTAGACVCDPGLYQVCE